MDLNDIMKELEALGSEQTVKVLKRHGARDPFFGVRIADMKKLVSKVKKANKADGKDGLHQLALGLYKTGNSDAMYMAAYMVDPLKITRDELQEWVEGAYWYMLSDYTVAWTASASPYGWDMAMKWMESKNQFIRIIKDLAAQGAKGIILGCTEISLLIHQKDTALPLFDTTAIHARAAVEFALGTTDKT